MALPKFVGCDCELSTTGRTAAGAALPPWQATRAILAEIDAAFERRGTRCWTRRPAWYTVSPTPRCDDEGGTAGGPPAHAHSSDCLRHWAPNGQCFYSDLGHLECATAESLSPKTVAAQGIAALSVAEEARSRAEEIDPGTRYTLTTHNADAYDPSVSWGSHISKHVTTELWEDLFFEIRHPARLNALASGLAAAVAFFGAGYLLPLPNGRIVFSLSGRAHHLGKLISLETTIPFQRGLLNSRREPHVAGAERLHLIAFDYVLASAALRCSFLQCVVAAAEEGYSGLGLYDPLGAVRTWSWNLDLKTGKLPATALLLDGRKLTLPEYIRTWTTELHSMVEQKLIPDAVAPDAAELLPRIIELTHHAEAGDLARCARHLDWAAKLLMILRTCRDGNAGLGDARARLTDQDYGNTDSRRGWFWRLWQEGAVDPLVSDGDAQAFMIDGPPETRAWARGRLVQRFCQAISDMDWSYVELRRSNSWWASLRIELPEITSLNCAAADRLFVAAKDVSELERLLYAQPDRRHDQSAYATSAGDEHPDNGSAP